jgi:hypothetical protein
MIEVANMQITAKGRRALARNEQHRSLERKIQTVQQKQSEPKDRVAKHRAAHVSRSEDDEEQPEEEKEQQT